MEGEDGAGFGEGERDRKGEDRMRKEEEKRSCEDDDSDSTCSRGEASLKLCALPVNSHWEKFTKAKAELGRILCLLTKANQKMSLK